MVVALTDFIIGMLSQNIAEIAWAQHANMYLKVAELMWFNMGYSVAAVEQPDCDESTSSLLISSNSKFEC